MTVLPTSAELAKMRGSQIFGLLSEIARGEAERIRQTQEVLSRLYGGSWTNTAVHDAQVAMAEVFDRWLADAKRGSVPKNVELSANIARSALIGEQVRRNSMEPVLAQEGEADVE